MPRIPAVSGYVPSANVVQMPRVRPSPLGGAIQGAAGDIERAAGYLQARDEEDARIWNAKAAIEAEGWGLDELQRIDLSGEDQTGLTDTFTKTAEEKFKAIGDTAPNATAKQFWDLTSAELAGRLRRQATDQEGKFRVNKRVTSLSDLIETSANAVATNPGLFGKVYAQAKWNLEHTEIPSDIRAKLDDQLSLIGRSAVAGMIERDPYQAEREMRAGKWDGFLDAGDRVSLYNSAQTAIKSREAEARAAAAESRAIAAENANSYMAGFQDYAAYRAAGNPPDPKLEAKYSPENIAKLGVKEAPAWAKKAADVQAQGDLMLALRTAETPEERAKIVETAKATTASPDNYQFNAAMAGTIEATAAAFDKRLADKPGEVAAQSGRVQDAIKSGDGATIVNSMFAEQERLGVPEAKRVALPEAFAASVADRVNSLAPEQQAGEVQALAAEYGSAWPAVFRQIGGKLKPEMATVATMPAGRGATLLAAAAGLKPSERTAGLDSEASGDVDAALVEDDTMVALRSSLSLEQGGSNTYATTETSVKALALEYMRRDGLSASDAAAQAAKEVTAGFQFAEANGRSVRVPADQDAGMIQSGMEAVTDGFDGMGYDLPPSASGMEEGDIRDTYVAALQRNAQWINDPQGRGLYLWDGETMVSKGGAPVLFSWDDLKAGKAP